MKSGGLINYAVCISAPGQALNHQHTHVWKCRCGLLGHFAHTHLLAPDRMVCSRDISIIT